MRLFCSMIWMRTFTYLLRLKFESRPFGLKSVLLLAPHKGSQRTDVL